MQFQGSLKFTVGKMRYGRLKAGHTLEIGCGKGARERRGASQIDRWGGRGRRQG
jgi:hypothetical protein